MRRMVLLAMAVAAAAWSTRGRKPIRCKSLYTTVDLQGMQAGQAPPRAATHGSAMACRGSRFTSPRATCGSSSASGRAPRRRRAATQTLGPFNSIFEAGSHRATIEWRFDRRGDQTDSYAAIVALPHVERCGAAAMCWWCSR